MKRIGNAATMIVSLAIFAVSLLALTVLVTPACAARHDLGGSPIVSSVAHCDNPGCECVDCDCLDCICGHKFVVIVGQPEAVKTAWCKVARDSGWKCYVKQAGENADANHPEGWAPGVHLCRHQGGKTVGRMVRPGEIIETPSGRMQVYELQPPPQEPLRRRAFDVTYAAPPVRMETPRYRRAQRYQPAQAWQPFSSFGGQSFGADCVGGV